MAENSKQPNDPKPVTKIIESVPQKVWRNTPKFNGGIVIAALVFSLLAHIGSGVKLERWRQAFQTDNKLNQKLPPVKIKIVEKKPQDPPKKILETPQQKTEKPEEAEYAGTVDHKAEKQTRVSEKQHRIKSANPGNKGNPKARGKEAKPKQIAKLPEKIDRTKQPPKVGKIGFEPVKPRKPRNAYEAMLPSSVNDLAGQMDAGFQDYVDEKIEEGDRIDINTTEYRYIGYFTNMRKAIELVWVYPSSASRRGMQGKVGIEFVIHKDGNKSRIKVIRSSGYKLLDDAIEQAIRDATFAPLPSSFDKERLLVTGNFTYVLNSYGSH